MPTFTAIALDRLLEPGSQTHTQKAATKPKPPPPAKAETSRPVPAPPAKNPALYATPESTQVPDSPSSFPPSSPYIINHKRRGPRLLKTLSQSNVGSDAQPLPALAKRPEALNVGLNNGVAERNGDAEETMNVYHGKSPEVEPEGGDAAASASEQEQPEFEFQHGNLEDFTRVEDLVKPVNVGTPRGGENDDFFDLQDSLSTASNTEVDDAGGLERPWKPGTPVGEFYDAFEEISSDGAARSSRSIDEELREMRLSLLTEIEKRKQAEEALEDLQSQWTRLSRHLSLVALTLPPPPAGSERAGDSSMDPGAELCQQVTVSRFVAAAIARGFARAEVESEMEPLIATKNFEIARLSDRVQYYEAANREMSQRNQEAVEMARQQRNRRKQRQQKWFWGSVGLAVTVGAAAIAWSYLPSSSQPAPGEDNDHQT